MIRFKTCCQSLTSQRIATALDPSSFADDVSASALRVTKMTLAPWATMWRAVAALIPRRPPVITIVFQQDLSWGLQFCDVWSGIKDGLSAKKMLDLASHSCKFTRMEISRLHILLHVAQKGSLAGVEAGSVLGSRGVLQVLRYS